jgi:hypothetical protein
MDRWAIPPFAASVWLLMWCCYTDMNIWYEYMI